MRTQKVAIIGVGLLGGSLALALRNQKGTNIIGWNHRVVSRKKASKILPVAPTFEKAVEDADVIVLCSHTSDVVQGLRKLTALIHPRTLILDVSSVKGEIARAASRIPGMNRHFVPCHPMAGKEKSGVAFADARLYQNRFVFLTPLPGTSKALVQRTSAFWKKIGAIPTVVDPVQHDQNVALTSHLPHLLASALMGLYGQFQKRNSSLRMSVGSGFRDFTRIAAGNPAMWSDIMETNSVEIRRCLSLYRQRLGQLEKDLRKGRHHHWLAFFKKARLLRERLG